MHINVCLTDKNSLLVILRSLIQNGILQEHKCVLASCRQLEGEGFKVTYLPVSNMGLISMEELEKAIQPDTALVTIMFVNNEIGVRQPIRQIGVKMYYL
jgi:cysteine sulfinate desulfinase/cysteine desulfurase-like protein